MRIVLALLCSLAACLGQNVIDSYRYAAAGVPLTTNLVSYFQMDEASGNAIDIHAGKTFTQTGTVGSAAGKINTARTFATTGNAFTRADDVAFEPGSGPFFITLWVKTTNLAQSAGPSIFAKANTGQWEWEITFIDATNLLYLYLDGSGGGYVESTTAFVSDTWQFVACGWDGTSAKISINGGAFSTTAYAGPMTTGTSPIYIGTRATTSINFQGTIDEVAFWKGRSLTITEVLTLFNGGAGKAYSTW